MVHRVRNRRSDKRHVAPPVGWCEAVARRRVLVGVLLTTVLLATGAAGSVPSGAAGLRTAPGTVPTPDIGTPGVSPVTVSVPGGETPPVSVPPVTVAPVATPPVSGPPVPPTPTAPASPVASTPAAPAATVRSTASAAAAPTRASLAAERVSARRRPTRRDRPASDPAPLQNRLRDVVVGLSQCLSILSSRSQRLLLLRAGIGTVRSDSRRAVARTLRMSVAREARVEHASRLSLKRAARERRCGVTPVWIHVPARDRLVLVDPVLTHRSL